jgi:hypothetical protein
MAPNGMSVFTNDEEWVIAADPADAAKVCDELGLGADYADMEWTRCDDAKPFTFHDDDASETKTFGEWAALKGRSYFASANY